MALSLDQEIGRKTDALRRMDPRVAQAQAKQSDDFLSLIALQKLKSEKDAAQRDLALKMEQRPETIAKQREEELLKRNKDELLKQTAGIMNVAQQRQQQNLQRAAQQPPTQPRAAAPMQRGMGSLAGQVRPEIARMAGGGIVGYQQGTLVDGEEEEEDEEEIVVEEGIDPYSGGIDALTQAALSRSKGRPSVLSRLRRGAPSPNTDRRVAEAQRRLQDRNQRLRSLNTYYDDPFAGGLPENAAKAAPPPSPKVDDKKLVPGVTPGTTPGIAGRGAGLPSISIPKVTAQAPDYSGVGAVGKGILDAAGLGGSMESRRDDSYKYLMGDDAARYQKLMDRLDALNKKQSDPTDLGLRQFQAWASGIGRKGLGAGAPALMAERDRQAKAERERLAEMLGLEKELMTAQRGARSSALQQAMQDRRTAANIMSSTTVDERKAARDFVKNQLDADKSNQQAKLKELQIEATNALNKAIKDQESQARIQARLDRMAENKTKYIKSYIDADQGLMQMRAAETKAIKDGDTKKAQQISASIKKRTDLITLGALETLNKIGFLDTEERLFRAAGLEPLMYEGITRAGKADKYIQAAGG
jgi:hypothetical protein